jgi:DUF971 family protein
VIVKKVSRIKSHSATGDEIGTGISILLEDGSQSNIDTKALRTNCPCATCVEERAKNEQPESTPKRSSLLRIVSSETEDQLNLVQIWPVGNYALGLRWGDGHDTGIYPFSVLLSLVNNGS